MVKHFCILKILIKIYCEIITLIHFNLENKVKIEDLDTTTDKGNKYIRNFVAIMVGVYSVTVVQKFFEIFNGIRKLPIEILYSQSICF